MEKAWLNYHHLLYFMTIAQEGGVAKAAASLKLGQSTLSTQLSQFEHNIGLKLFERRQKRLHLTEAGQVALAYAREIFRLGDEMLDALHDRRHMSRISVQIGAIEGIPKANIVSLVAAAQRQQDCVISIEDGLADDLLRALKAHEIDLALFNYRPVAQQPFGIKAKLAGRRPVVVLGAAQYASLAHNFPSSLAGRPCIMPDSSSRLRHDVEHFLKLQGIYLDVVLEAQDSSLQALLAASGRGLIFVSESIAQELALLHGLARIGVFSDVYDELWLVSGERRVENPVASFLFKEFSL